MDWLPLVAGLACVVYTTAEIAAAAGRSRAAGRFGAVDLGTGRDVAVVLDRRTGPSPSRALRRLR